MTLTRAEFESLVRREHAAVYRTAARLLPAADAEDVTQQVFVRVLEGKVRLGDDPALTLRWLAGRLALNTLRGARHRRTHERSAMQRDPRPDAEPAVGAAITAEERRALRAALDDLPPDLRAAVALRYQEDFTFEAIARALACSLSTAHDRVRRGLVRLQQALARAGFVALGNRLDRALRDLEAPAVPAALQDQLLALSGKAAPAVAAASAWPIALLVLVGAGAAFAVAWMDVPKDGRDSAPPGATHGIARAREERSAAQDPAPVRRPVGPAAARGAGPSAGRAAAEQEATEPFATFTGNAYDAADGTPLAGARVSARSHARGSKGNEFRCETVTDASGRFTLTVPIDGAGRETYSLWVQADDYVPHVAPHTLAARATVDVRAALRRWATDRRGEWQMEVSVHDDQGAPVPDALVTVHRRQRDRELRREQPREAAGKTDATGRVQLRGDHHGEKLVHVAVWRGRFAPAVRELAIEAPGPHALTVELAVGRVVAGVVRAAGSGAPVAALGMRVLQGGDEIGWAHTDAEGRFRFEGCGDGPVALAAHAPEWSPFTASGFAPGDETIELRVKRREDARAHGEHQGELHGTARDTATGEPVTLGAFEVDTHWIGEGGVAELIEEVLNPRPVQRGAAAPLPAPSATFHVCGLAPGRYGVIARRRGYAPAWAGPFELGAKDLVSGIELALTRGGTVEGVVVDARGTPVARAVVWLTAREDAIGKVREVAEQLAGKDRYPRYTYRECDAAGRFVVEHVPPGLVLRAVAADGSAGVAVGEPFTLRGGARHEVTLRLRP